MIYRIIISVLIATICATASANTLTLDTMYYDRSWKAVNGPYFASYYKVFENDTTSNKPKRFRNFYITGEIQADGYYITLDSIDDTQSIIDHEFISYYKNGNIQHCSVRENTKLTGEYCDYYPDGTLKRKSLFKNGLLDGITSEFSDGICTQYEYKDGDIINGYYLMSNPEGFFSRVKLNDNTPIFQSPAPNEIKSQYIDDILWYYYVKDGLIVELSMSSTNDYGKYYRVYIRLTNNSFFPVEIDPETFTAGIRDNKGFDKALKIQSATQYDKRINRTQKWEEALTSFSAGVASVSAGLSTTTSNTYGISSSGTYWGHTKSTTYNTSEAIQTRIMMSQELAKFTEQNAQKRKVRNDGYLKRTTINPGECVEGYFNILRKKGKEIYVFLNIADAVFQFWINTEKK